uniref:Secreted protein n=1 Tax=Physcomitrium patens TaxID=3218 RepID=A0A2K1IG39_PHYPA|nr:hypothetical protein PHYPA_028832 [Physcomitrium patens]
MPSGLLHLVLYLMSYQLGVYKNHTPSPSGYTKCTPYFSTLQHTCKLNMRPIMTTTNLAFNHRLIIHCFVSTLQGSLWETGDDWRWTCNLNRGLKPNQAATHKHRNHHPSTPIHDFILKQNTEFLMQSFALECMKKARCRKHAFVHALVSPP